MKKPGKRELDKKVSRLHKGTKTLYYPLRPFHDKLRHKFRWYYKWHSWFFSNPIHWLILLLSVLGLFYLSFETLRIRNINKYPRDNWILVGTKSWGQDLEKVNIVVDKGRLKLSFKDGEFKNLGYLRIKKLDLEQKVIWDVIEFNADIPYGTEIKFRTRGANESIEKLEKAKWSPYYVNSGADIQDEEKIMAPRYKYLELEISLSSDGESTPTLNWVTLKYIKPQKPGKVESFLYEQFKKLGRFVLKKLYDWFEDYPGDIKY